MDNLEDAAAGPAAFNPERLHWEDIPTHVRELIENQADAQVANASSVTQGFSPGYAGVLTFADGAQLFIKAVSGTPNAHSRELAAAEAAACVALPAGVPAPRLLWSSLDEWAVLAFEVVGGASPQLPWKRQELALALEAVERLAGCRPAPGHSLRPMAEAHQDLFTNWRTYAAHTGPARDRRRAQLGDWAQWVEANLPALIEWEAEGPAAVAGDRLAHGDLRADNMLIDGDHAWIVDWPHATVAAPWVDLAIMLPSVQMQRGGDAHEIFAAHPLSAGVETSHVRAVVAAMAGYFLLSSLEPPPPSIPTLRAFQRGQALPALSWLQELEPTVRSPS